MSCRPRFAIALLLALAVLAVFHPALTSQFVEWDDDVNLVHNSAYRGLDVSHLVWMSRATVMGHYIPLTWVTFGLDYVLWGMDPRGYHLTNLVLHTASTILLVAVALRLFARATSLAAGPRLFAATIAALFFSIHPLRAESVAWITERRDVLCGFLFLLTIYTYLAAQDAVGRRRRLLLAASVASYAGATLSKAIVMGLPLILLVLDVYPLRRIVLDRGVIRRSRAVLLEKTPYFVIALACAAISYYVVRTVTHLLELGEFSPAGRTAMALYTLWFYVTRTAFPIGLSPLYELPLGISVVQPRFALVALAVVAITVALVALRKRWPAGLAAWTCYAIVLGPVSGIVQPGFQLAHDRYSYLSCLPWALIVGAAAGVLLDARTTRVRPLLRHTALAGMMAWIVALGWLGFQQTKVWEDSYALWSHAVNVEPTCAVCHGNLAAYLVNHDLIDPALFHAARAMELRPDRPRPYATYGWALVKAGRPQDAIPYFEKFIAALPESNDVGAFGVALLRTGRARDALGPLERGVTQRPDDVVARVNYAAALVAVGERDAAMEQYRRALAADPSSPAARYGLGWAFAQFGERAAAEREHRVLAILDARLAAQLASEIATVR